MQCDRCAGDVQENNGKGERQQKASLPLAARQDAIAGISRLAKEKEALYTPVLMGDGTSVTN